MGRKCNARCFLAWFGLFITLLSTVYSYSLDRRCVVDTYIMNPNTMYGFNSANTAKLYPTVEAFLQVFKQLVVPCDGWIKGVFFFPATPVIKNLTIANVRLVELDNFLRVINTTKIDNVYPPMGASGWFYYNLPNPIYALAGDYIAVYYDNWRTEASDAAIRTADASVDQAAARYTTDVTYVFQADGRMVAAGTGLQLTESQIRRRLPALSIYLSNVSPTTTPLITTTLPAGLPQRCVLDILPDDINCNKTSLRYRYYANVGSCLEFLGCDTMSTSNNFASSHDCVSLCIWPYSTTPALTTASINGSSSFKTDQRCSMSLTTDDTNCNITSERWNYNPFYTKCGPFLGCTPPSLSGNNWDSEYQCLASCVQGNSTSGNYAARCSSDSSLGQWLCLYKEPRYFWDQPSASCKQFYGCPYRDNMGFPLGNNFASYAGCISSCSSRS